MTRKALKRLSLDLRYAYSLACDFGHADLQESHAIALQQERQHRRLGRGMVGVISPRASADACACLFALRAFVTPAAERRFDVRSDYLTGYRAAVRAEQAQPDEYRAFCAFYAWVRSVDYCAMVQSCPPPRPAAVS